MDKKEIIAKKCFHMINDGDTVMVDASSTALPLLRLLTGKNSIVVITNSTKAPLIFADSDIKVFLSGGELATNTHGLVGGYAEDFVRGFNADICFLSVTGLCEDGRLTDNSIAENLVRRAMLSRARKRVLMLDSSKIGKAYISTLCTLNEIDAVVSDSDISYLFPQHKENCVQELY